MQSLDNLEKDNATGENHTGRSANTPVTYLAASTITGDKVYNHQGEYLGQIKDIMLNIREGRIGYVVIEFGGVMSIGKKYFAIPFDALTIDTDRHSFILDQRRDTLEHAPGFDRDHWPGTNAHHPQSRAAYWGGFMGVNTGLEY